MKINQLKKENNLQSTLSVAENISKLISKKQHKNTGKVIRLSKNIHKMEQHSRQEYIEIAGIVLNMTNDLLKGKYFLYFQKLVSILIN